VSTLINSPELRLYCRRQKKKKKKNKTKKPRPDTQQGDCGMYAFTVKLDVPHWS